MLRELFRRGVDMVDLEVTGADLEEAFLTPDPPARGRVVTAAAKPPSRRSGACC